MRKYFAIMEVYPPDRQSMEQIQQIIWPTDVLVKVFFAILCGLSETDVLGWGENDREVSFTCGA